MQEGLDGFAGIIVVGLGFEEDIVTRFEPEGVEFWLLPVEVMDFGIKIKRQKSEIVTGKIVFILWVAEADNEFHGDCDL